ncbi:hypothetical protein [Catenulispora pinisilvae]|nr:hypothetical protein [Catenulispora pinisilvae]
MKSKVFRRVAVAVCALVLTSAAGAATASAATVRPDRTHCDLC